MCEAKSDLIRASWLPIKNAMQEQDLGMYQLAKKADVNHATLYAWENGDYKPKVDKIQRICSVLGLDYRNFV